MSFYHWGLAPYWAKQKEQDFLTANAKAEGIFKKPAWKVPISSQRCIVPSTGFFEWRHEGNNKYPYFVYQNNKSIISFAGIWDQWIDKKNQSTYFSFSILTVPANDLMIKIHNTKKRMPLILNPEDENTWVNNETSEDKISKIMSKSSPKLEANTIRQDFLKLPDHQKLTPWNFPELELIDLF